MLGCKKTSVYNTFRQVVFVPLTLSCPQLAYSTGANQAAQGGRLAFMSAITDSCSLGPLSRAKLGGRTGQMVPSYVSSESDTVSEPPRPLRSLAELDLRKQGDALKAVFFAAQRHARPMFNSPMFNPRSGGLCKQSPPPCLEDGNFFARVPRQRSNFRTFLPDDNSCPMVPLIYGNSLVAKIALSLFCRRHVEIDGFIGKNLLS